MREFCRLRLQEFLARGRVEEQVTNRDGRSQRQPNFLNHKNLASMNLNQCAGSIVRRTGLQTQPGNGGNRRQGIAAKAQGGDIQKVFCVLDFGRCMALEGEQSVVPDHPAAVINDLNELLASSLNLNLDSRGTRIQRVLQQLLDHGGGTLDNLPGGNLVGNGFGENVNSTHRFSFKFRVSSFKKNVVERGSWKSRRAKKAGSQHRV